ncbi:hypothetical protein GCM10010435_93180 [Winogradskya consettensis]|uniref:Uncharacterized protein n=1 Tax=Winogradskya consettensis TaxID=113560 RepID=A0A919SVZ7_9ACTN|nr:hypothetical protein [Actinoplanes consettensis]GIM79355.1 hypothetical protein Aco04nite_65080 [Actinoplanes consettensis]
MTVFYCARCSRALTPDLTALPAMPETPDDPIRPKGQDVAPSTVPLGHYATESEEDAVSLRRHGHDKALRHSGGRRHALVVIHPEDAPALEYLPGFANAVGCCGPDGTHGPNQACPCGTPLATLTADCMGPYELRLDPLRVFAFDN